MESAYAADSIWHTGIGKSVRSPDHAAFCGFMVLARRAAGLSQHALAHERRLNVVEFVDIAHALGADHLKLMAEFMAGGGDKPGGPKRARRETDFPEIRAVLPECRRLQDTREAPGQRHKIAQDLLDHATIDPASLILLGEIHAGLRKAAHIAKVAEACALAGSVTESVAMSMDIEQLIHEVSRLQDAASLLNKLSRE